MTERYKIAKVFIDYMFGEKCGAIVILITVLLIVPEILVTAEEAPLNPNTGSSGSRAAFEPCEISGYVNNTTGSPLTGASVKVMDSGGAENDTNTDGSGRFEINVAPGKTLVTVYSRGYRGQNATVNAVPGLNPNNNFTLKPLGPELVTVTGFVNDTEGAPLPYSIIYITDGATWENFTFTDRQGRYVVHCVNGPIFIVAINESYVPAFKQMQVVNNTVYYVDFELKKPPRTSAVVKGYVRDEAGVPLDGVRVLAVNDTHLYNNRTETDLSGYYELGVIEDWLHVIVEEKGYFDFHDYFSIETNDTIWLNITLTETGPKNARFFGSVADEETGDPIENASIAAVLEDVGWEEEIRTDAAGEYEIYLYPGEYEVEVGAEGYFQEGFDLTMEEGQEIEERVFLERSPPANSLIKGYVRDTENDLVDALFVMVVDAINDTRMGGPVENGYFEIPVWEGIFLLAAFAEGYGVSAKNIYVPNASVVWVNLTMFVTSANVRGFVKDEAGEPVPGANIQFTDEKTLPMGEPESDGDGYYETALHASTFAVVVTDEEDDLFETGEYDPYVKEHVVEGNRDHWINVTLHEADNAEIRTDVLFKDWNNVTLEGRSILSENKTKQTALFFDLILGNNDLSLDESEMEKINKKFEEEVVPGGDREGEGENGEKEMFPDDTKDLLRVDGHPYRLDEENISLEFAGFLGDWTSLGRGSLRSEALYVASRRIVENVTHQLDINLSWKYHDEKEDSLLNLFFPERYEADDWEEIDNISMEGGDPFTIREGYNPNTLYEGEDPEEGVDYIWTRLFVNRTYNITDISDEEGECGGNVSLGLRIAQHEEIEEVGLEYRFEDDNVSEFTVLNGRDGVYEYVLEMPEDRSDALIYRFKIKVGEFHILTFPETGSGRVNITDKISPEAHLSSNAGVVNTGTEVLFNASLSTDNIGIASYNFTFGDGSYRLSSDPTVPQTFNETGDYTISVNVTDPSGNFDTADVTLRVMNDTAAPEVLRTDPGDGAENVSRDVFVKIWLSEDVVLEDVTLLFDNETINYTYDTDDLLITLFPDRPLEFGTVYTIELSARDEIGNWLRDHVFIFTTMHRQYYDSDGDGVPDGKDDFPDNPTGATDTDGDGKPDVLLIAPDWNGTVLTEDTDDDNDNWSDIDEVRLGTDPRNGTDHPSDLDGDGTADEEDGDIDGDGVPNDEDTDPRDPSVGGKEAGSGGSTFLILGFVILGLAVIAAMIFILGKNRDDEGGIEESGTEEIEVEVVGRGETGITTEDLELIGHSEGGRKEGAGPAVRYSLPDEGNGGAKYFDRGTEGGKDPGKPASEVGHAPKTPDVALPGPPGDADEPSNPPALPEESSVPRASDEDEYDEDFGSSKSRKEDREAVALDEEE